MKRFFGRRFFLGVLLAALGFLATPAHACSVPVFRYALERWVSDQYRVVIFHRGPLSKAERALVRDLGPDGLAGRKHANLIVETVDVAEKLAPQMQKLWAAQKSPTLPWMVVRYPRTVNIAPAWSGPLSKSVVATLIDSPARREIAKRILKGQTAVWIFLESGKKKADAAAFLRLKTRLAHEQKTLKLPAIDEKDIADGLIKPGDAKNLRIQFSIVRVSRKDPKERLLVQMLLGSEGSGNDSLRDPEYIAKTMAFPVFGRGRIRPGLVGAGIAADTIHEACAYLVGPCTCQLKSGIENRGMDLVMPVNWNELVDSTIKSKTPPPLIGLGQFIKPQPKKPAVAPKPRSRK
ncbi:MAG: hypothetical protein IID45_03260 [Planctomycetes bacterium]|nr:hypothetical protein [Planctomycetota bacterium]